MFIAKILIIPLVSVIIFGVLFYLTQLHFIKHILHFIKQQQYLHIGIIPDGNRRWSLSNGKTIEQGYYTGFNIVYTVFKQLINLKLPPKSLEITLFVCSRDNLLKRSPDNVNVIYNCLWKLVEILNTPDFKRLRIGIKMVGNIELINDTNLRNELLNYKRVGTNENENESLKVNLAIGYDCFDELLTCFEKLQPGATKINVQNNLHVKNNIDLVIRTGNEKRTSGFFPLQTQYAEWFFLKKHWPDFSIKEFLNIIFEFSKINRRFGK